MLIVSGFSAFVDWRKEKEFVLRANEEKDGKQVSIQKSNWQALLLSDFHFFAKTTFQFKLDPRDAPW